MKGLFLSTFKRAKNIIRYLLLSIVLLFSDYGFGEESIDFIIAEAGRAVNIAVDPEDARVVSISAEMLAGDIEMVSGAKPIVSDSISGSVIIAGTYGKSKYIKKLSDGGKLDLSHVDRGQW